MSMERMSDLTPSLVVSRPVVNVRKKPLAWSVKKQIVEYASKHPEVTQGVIASKFGCNRSTVCKILKKRERFGVVVNSNDAAIQKQRLDQVDEMTYEWIMSMRSANIPLTGAIIKETASQISHRIGHVNFQPTSEWLRQLCRRFGIPLSESNNGASAPSKNTGDGVDQNNNNNNSTASSESKFSVVVDNNNNNVDLQSGSVEISDSSSPPPLMIQESNDFEEYDGIEDEEGGSFGEDDEEDVMLVPDDSSYADHCLTDDSPNDVTSILNNYKDFDKSRLVSHEEVMAAFETIRIYFETEGTYGGEDLEILFELEQLTAKKKKKQ